MIKLRDEKGAVLMLSLMLLAILTILGTSVIKSSVTENLITGNTAKLMIEFYNAENALKDAVEKSAWFDDIFINTDCDSLYSSFNSPLIDENGDSFVKIEIKCINNTDSYIKELSTEANDLPSQPHIATLPQSLLPILGTDDTDFQIRRYGITASSKGGTKLQIGVFRVFEDDGSKTYQIPSDNYPLFNIYYWRQF
jgi:hypothetical protein